MKVFFAFMFLCLGTTLMSLAQEDPDVRWFEALFEINNKLFVDDEVGQLMARRVEAGELGNQHEEIKALIELGVYHFMHASDYEQAMGWFVQSLTLEDSYQLGQYRIYTLLAMARVFEEVGDYHKSEDFLNQAFEIEHARKNLNLLTLILNEMGRVSALQSNSTNAAEKYKLVLKYARQLQLPDREADALFQLGQLHCKEKEYKLALESHKEALAIRRSEQNKVKEAISLNNIGELYRLMKNHDRAIANHEAALNIRQAIKDVAGIAESYNNLGALYLEMKDYKKAIVQLNLALQAGHEAQKQEQIRNSYDYLSTCYKQLNDFKKALEYKENHLAIERFIENEKNERQLLETQNRYTINKKESAINQLKSDREQDEKVIKAQTRLRNILILLIACGLIIGLLVLYLYIQNRRSNRKLQHLNATKDKLFSIIGHDLKGPLNSLSSFISLLHNHTDSLSKEEIKILSKDIDKSLKNLFTLLENLLEWSRSQTGNIDFKKEVFDLSSVIKENEALLKGQIQNKGLTLRNETQEGVWVEGHRNSINTVLRNLISNAIKFTPSGGTITVSAEVVRDHWRINVTDTGVGMCETALQKLFKIGTKHSTLGTAQEKGTGLGLILCKDFVEKNGGKIGVESKVGAGSKFYFTVPGRP